MPNGERATEKLAVDAQVLIRSLLPSRTHELFRKLKGHVQLLTTPGKIQEIKRWLPSVARGRGLDADLLMEGVVSLPVDVVPDSVFKGKLETARKQIGKRDPDDVDLLALALAEQIPLWSDDKDFEDSTAEVFSTADMVEYAAKFSV